MGDDLMVRDLNSQDPAATILRGRRPFQALTAADEQARQRSLADDSAALQVGDLVVNPSCLSQCLLYRHVSLACLDVVCCLAEDDVVCSSFWHVSGENRCDEALLSVL